MNQRAPRSPRRLTAHTRAVEKALEAVANNVADLRELEIVFDRARRAASAMASASPPERTHWNTSEDDYAGIIATNFTALLDQCGWKQSDLAEAMNGLGFRWTRVTVAEIKGRDRKISLEELVGLAALFAVPVLHFLLPDDFTFLVLNERDSLDPREVCELVLGAGGVKGDGGLHWEAAARVCDRLPKDQVRPAVDLWAATDDTDMGEG